MKTIKHILFDYDGILVDSENIYFQTWCSVLNEEGEKICANFHKGQHESEVYEKVKPYLKVDWPFEQISKYRKSLFDNIVFSKGLELISGIDILLEKLYKMFPLSIVSNSELKLVENGLEATGLKSYFINLYCFNETIKRKPMPDLYHLALADLKLKEKNVIAIEDSISGMESALKANIPVICINKDISIKQFCQLHKIPYFQSPIELASSLKTII